MIKKSNNKKNLIKIESIITEFSFLKLLITKLTVFLNKTGEIYFAIIVDLTK